MAAASTSRTPAQGLRGFTSTTLVKYPAKEVGQEVSVRQSWWDAFGSSEADASVQANLPRRGPKALCVVVAWDPEYKWAREVQHQGAYMLRLKEKPDEDPRPMQPVEYASYKDPPPSRYGWYQLPCYQHFLDGRQLLT
jgi:hypothetical protein